MRLWMTLSFIINLFIFDVASACESCVISKIGRDKRNVVAESQDKKWFLEYLYEHQDWKEIPALEANTLHHQGHDAHDKTDEDYYHFTVGGHLSDRFTVLLEAPYIIRCSIEIDDHARLGDKEVSQGWGDLNLLGDYRFIKDEKKSLGLVGGVKFPVGATKESNSFGDRFEPELQPGSGAYDYVAGTAYGLNFKSFELSGNALYIFKTQGSQGFRYGDLFSTAVGLNCVFNPEDKIKIKSGIETNFQYEGRQSQDHVDVSDSGGQTIFVGPTVDIQHENIDIFGSFSWPAYQHLGGVHQEIVNVWTAGAKISF